MDILVMPILTYVLLSFGCIGVLIFLFIPQRKIPVLLISIFFFLFYFGSRMVLGNAQIWMIFITLIGMGLLVLEAFLPSFGTLGLLGLIFIGIGIIQSSQTVEVGISAIGICFIVSVITFIILVKKYGINPIFQKLMLTDVLSQPEPNKLKDAFFVGLEGKVMTPLRPTGVALFNHQEIHVLSEGGYIRTEANVKIVKIKGNNVVVREIKQDII